MLLKEYERDPLFTRATEDGVEVKGSKDDPLACITSYDAVIVTAFVGTGSLLQSGIWFWEQTCVSTAHQEDRHHGIGFPKQ